jgi:hypothetical protein
LFDRSWLTPEDPAVGALVSLAPNLNIGDPESLDFSVEGKLLLKLKLGALLALLAFMALLVESAKGFLSSEYLGALDA